MDKVNQRKIQYCLLFHTLIHQDKNEIQRN